MLRRTVAALLFLASACARPEPTGDDAPPAAEFLVTSGDSTFWVRTGPEGVRVRRSPILLALVEGRFHEVYVVDDDRSYFDAVLVGQRIYRRDLVTGDSLVVFDDSTVEEVAREYARRHPGQRPLGPDDEASDDPSSVATTETEILAIHGPYLSFEHHTDVDAVGRDSHSSRRGVLDLRTGRLASLAELFGAGASLDVVRAGERAFVAALDSVRRSGDDRARRAVEVMDAFAYDPASFALTDLDGAPAVAFLAAGGDGRAAGLALPVPPVEASAPSWWEKVRATLPRADADSADRWQGERYAVVARYDSTGEHVDLALRSDEREWPLASLPAPARRLWLLDAPPVDSASRRALARAFDEAARYGGETRTASAPAPVGPRVAASRPATTPAVATRSVRLTRGGRPVRMPA